MEEDRLAFVTERAYALACSGLYEDCASIERALAAQGYEAVTRWLERPGLSDTLDEICIANRQFRDKASGRPSTL
jgi:hypothetical protein